MQRNLLTGQRLVAVCLAGCVLFNYPLLALFDRPETVWGVPLLYVFVFAAWLLLIAALAWVVEGRQSGADAPHREGPR